MLLSVLAVTSILGTIIPQNDVPAVYLGAYGQVFYNLFDFIGLFDMYHSIWFQLMLFMLSANIIICTFKRLPGVWKLVFARDKNQLGIFKKFSKSLEFTSDKKFENICELCTSAISYEFKDHTLNKVEESVVIYAESGRWTRLGVHVVHLSIVLLLLGGLISSIFGFEGYVNLAEGDTIDWIRLKGTNKQQFLDFSIRCDKFDIELYKKNGPPKEYRSKLTILKKDIPVHEKNVVVNGPMHYNGISIFQSSYGKIPSLLFNKSLFPSSLQMNFKSKISGVTYTESLKFGVPFNLPEALGKFCVLDYISSASFNGVDLGGALKCVYSPIGCETSEESLLLPLDFPNFDLMRGGAVVVSLSEQLRNEISISIDEKSIYYTGLQITKDPGKVFVYTGFFFILLGFIITLLMSHKKIYIKINKNKKHNTIIVTAHTNRNKLAVRALFERVHDFVSSDKQSCK